ncbi:hypothetical protein DMENIID0001_038780 [Sergentomyia squamirostris]
MLHLLRTCLRELAKFIYCDEQEVSVITFRGLTLTIRPFDYTPDMITSGTKCVVLFVRQDEIVEKWYVMLAYLLHQLSPTLEPC